jgi:hypothetical protein
VLLSFVYCSWEELLPLIKAAPAFKQLNALPATPPNEIFEQVSNDTLEEPGLPNFVVAARFTRRNGQHLDGKTSKKCRTELKHQDLHNQ